MSKSKENTVEKQSQQSGNAVVVVLVALVVVAVGALAYLSGQMAGEKNAGGEQPQNIASSPSAQMAGQAATPDLLPLDIKPGNPVVAKIGGQDVTRLDVLNYVQTLPPQTRQLPLQQLFPIAQEQVINVGVIAAKAKDVNLDDDAEVQRQLALAKEQIVRTVNLQNAVEAKVTDARVEEVYNEYVANFPDVEEVKASHILVDKKSDALDLLKQLQDGADFAALAAEKSKDSSGAKGGDLGYFLRTDVVETFGTAAFDAEPGSLVAEPVKSEFGFHVIKVEDKRKRQPVTLEVAAPELKARLRQAAVGEVMNEWRNDLAIERFDINGNLIEPAAGDVSSEEAEAPEAEESAPVAP